MTLKDRASSVAERTKTLAVDFEKKITKALAHHARRGGPERAESILRGVHFRDLASTPQFQSLIADLEQVEKDLAFAKLSLGDPVAAVLSSTEGAQARKETAAMLADASNNRVLLEVSRVRQTKSAEKAAAIIEALRSPGRPRVDIEALAKSVLPTFNPAAVKAATTFVSLARSHLRKMTGARP